MEDFIALVLKTYFSLLLKSSCQEKLLKKTSKPIQKILSQTLRMNTWKSWLQ